MYQCFGEGLDVSRLDREPFKFKHALVDHPALSIQSLARSLPELPGHCVRYSKGLSDLAINFDRAHIDHRNGLSLEETIETIRTSNSYIAVADPQEHPSFRDLYRDLASDVGHMIRLGGKGREVREPRMWMFIASPNAQTPFHFDRYSNFLMQVRGSKQVAVFPNFNEDIISAADCESYMDRAEAKPLWKPEFDRHATKFDFAPGEAIHIPYIAGHYVKNGAEDVSISLSFFFQTDETQRWTDAMRFNHRIRKRLGHLGLNPNPVGRSPWRDGIKAQVLPMFTRASTLLRTAKLRSPACVGAMQASLVCAGL